MFNKNIENIKKHTAIIELKNTATELKNSIESFKGLYNTEERISDPDDMTSKTVV